MPSQVSAPTLERGSAALLLLDLQRDFLDPAGVYARNGLPVDRLRGIVSTVERVARASRAAHLPIFASKFTIFTSPGGAPLGLDHIVKARPFLRREGFRLGDAGRDLIPELPRPDYELDKPRFSAFHGTPLEVLLRSLDIDTVVLTGIVTHGGVEATARDALIRDFSVVILEDCVAAFDEELHLASLRGMGLYLTVMNADAYLEAIAQPRSNTSQR
jgi:nicotinamidase-related amidase